MNKSSGADPGFSVEGSADPRGWGGGHQHTILPNFPQEKTA